MSDLPRATLGRTGLEVTQLGMGPWSCEVIGVPWASR